MTQRDYCGLRRAENPHNQWSGQPVILDWQLLEDQEAAGGVLRFAGGNPYKSMVGATGFEPALLAGYPMHLAKPIEARELVAGIASLHLSR